MIDRRKKTKNNFDLWLIAIAMGISIGLAIVLYRYEKWILSPKIRDQEPREPIAKIESVKKENKRRYAGSLTYLDVGAGESIYLGDTLFVSENSSLELKTPTGATLKLGSLTLVLVDKENNQVKFILNNGEINASLDKNEMLRFELEEELVTIEGSRGSRFKIKTQEMGHPTIQAQGAPIKVSYADKVFNLENDNLTLSDTNTGPAPIPTSDRSAPMVNNTPVPTKIKDEAVSINDVPLDLPIPFPANQQLFLIKKQASVLVMPKRLCSESCSLKITRGEGILGTWTFEKGTPPLIKFPVTPKEEGVYSVSLEDGTGPKSETSFEVRPFSARHFEEAIKNGRSVELLD